MDGLMTLFCHTSVEDITAASHPCTVFAHVRQKLNRCTESIRVIHFLKNSCHSSLGFLFFNNFFIQTKG